MKKEKIVNKVRVLFICVYNPARSQMAEAFLNNLGKERFIAESAGLEPGVLNPLVVKAMSEIGYDISKNKTKNVFDFYTQGKTFDYVITVCDPEAAEACPVFPGNVKRLHLGFKDPAALSGSEEQRMKEIRVIRDMIKDAIINFINETNPNKRRKINYGDKNSRDRMPQVQGA
jgi:arsenate reductase